MSPSRATSSLPALLLSCALLVGCGGDDEADAGAAPTSASGTPTAPPASAPADACGWLSDAQVSEALGRDVAGRPDGDVCAWGDLTLVVADATPAEFEEERIVNSADEPEPPALGLGDESYLILGSPGGYGSAGALVGGRKAVVAVPGDVPSEEQSRILRSLLQTVAVQL